MLLDSNIIIYAARQEQVTLRQFIAAHAPAVSAVSLVEVLGYHKLTAPERQLFEAFFLAATVLPISDPVVATAVQLRQQRKLSLGDALIAATALVFNRTLVTHNTADFQWIPGLRLLDPLVP